ncbi:ATP-dependent zinc protease [Tichowtungia aerotolerans]|uniref:ATP-dependent zinc protease n=2 Tax=Tichowtungia aerotolerans TaxID=2697043 RepID=A0A6P1MCN8_9BACT|nr:ATP-dependent zinc protease [Tichowtungia aerotolerans]
MTLGWREWCALPELGIPAIKAKVDTGAKTSALHTFGVEPFSQNGVDCVRFRVHPLQRNEQVVCECVAPVKDERVVSDSGGHRELRYIIETTVSIGDKSWPIEMSLTNRDTMRFRMLLGRRAMEEKVLVDPVASYLTGRKKARRMYGLV